MLLGIFLSFWPKLTETSHLWDLKSCGVSVHEIFPKEFLKNSKIDRLQSLQDLNKFNSNQIKSNVIEDGDIIYGWHSKNLIDFLQSCSIINHMHKKQGLFIRLNDFYSSPSIFKYFFSEVQKILRLFKRTKSS